MCGLYPEHCCPNRVRIKAVKWPINSTHFCPFLAKYLENIRDIQGTYVEISLSPQLLREGMEMMIDPLVSEKHLNLDCPLLRFDGGRLSFLLSCSAAVLSRFLFQERWLVPLWVSCPLLALVGLWDGSECVACTLSRIPMVLGLPSHRLPPTDLLFSVGKTHLFIIAIQFSLSIKSVLLSHIFPRV